MPSQSSNILNNSSSMDDSLPQRHRNNCSRKTKVCLILPLFIVIAAICAVFGTIYFEFRFWNPGCTGKECEGLIRLQSWMDRSENPCEDFYKYSCQGWISKHKLGVHEKKETSVLKELEKENSQLLKKLLSEDESWTLDSSASALKKSKDFYKSCISNPERVTPNQCEKLVKRLFGMVLPKLFVTASFKNYSRHTSALSSIGMHLRKILSQELSTTGWLQDWGLYTHIFNQIQNILIEFGDLRKVPTDYELDQFYSNITVSPEAEEFYNNIEKMGMVSFQEIIGKPDAGSMTQFEQWLEVETIFNRSTTGGAPYILIPPAFSKDPIFGEDYPDAINYARIGTSIGRQLGHALAYFLKVAETRLMSMSLLPSKNSLGAYRERKICVEEEYGNISMPFESLKRNNGTVATMEENVADLLGLEIAFAAFARYGKPLKTTLHNLSNEQIFFISAAQSHCSTFADQGNGEIAAKIMSPDALRVFRTMRNSKEFSLAFNCPVGSPYNPEKKCNFLD